MFRSKCLISFLPFLVGGVFLGYFLADVALPALRRSDIKGEDAQRMRDFLRQNPEVIREALHTLEAKDQALEAERHQKTILEQRDILLKSTHQAVVGNPQGKVTLIEFFDYNCGYCKKNLSDLVQFLKEEPDFKLILRDMPILSQHSMEASQVALALQSQFKGEVYFTFHQRLLQTKGIVGKEQALALAKEMGADMETLNRDVTSQAVQAAFAETASVVEALSLSGTPSFLLGDELIIGAINLEELRQKVKNVKTCGKTACS